MRLTLYTVPYCGYCARVLAELERLKVPYEEVSVGWSFTERDEVYRLSGQRRVPVLKDEANVVHESARIIDYLKRKYAGGS